MSLTTDPKDPDLGHGSDAQPVAQNKKYLVLSDTELAKGFTRPFRKSYVHVGERPEHPTRPITPEEAERFKGFNYVAFEAYGPERAPVTGRFWTQARLDAKACGSVTTMNDKIAETYARDPKFYGATYCCHCSRHLPVAEFVWQGTNERVGS